MSDLSGIRNKLQSQGIIDVSEVRRTPSFNVHHVDGHSGSHHRYDEDEKVSAAQFMNLILENDPECHDLLPVDPKTLDFLDSLQDGVILCKLVNCAVPNTIDMSKIILKPTIFQRNENLSTALKGAREIKCNIVNMGPSDFIDKRIHIVLGLLWQIIVLYLLNAINLEHCPEVAWLLEEGETMAEFNALSPEHVLIRWVRYHVHNAGSHRRVENLTTDLCDSECILILLNQLAPDLCTLEAMNVPDLIERADLTLEEANKLGCRRFITPQKMVQGHHKLMLAFLANLFNAATGLPKLTQEMKQRLRNELHIHLPSKAPQFTFHTSIYGFDGALNPPVDDDCIIL